MFNLHESNIIGVPVKNFVEKNKILMVMEDLGNQVAGNKPEGRAFSGRFVEYPGGSL